jgi:hypothetical protein
MTKAYRVKFKNIRIEIPDAEAEAEVMGSQRIAKCKKLKTPYHLIGHDNATVKRWTKHMGYLPSRPPAPVVRRPRGAVKRARDAGLITANFAGTILDE